MMVYASRGWVTSDDLPGVRGRVRRRGVAALAGSPVPLAGKGGTRQRGHPHGTAVGLRPGPRPAGLPQAGRRLCHGQDRRRFHHDQLSGYRLVWIDGSLAAELLDKERQAELTYLIGSGCYPCPDVYLPGLTIELEMIEDLLLGHVLPAHAATSKVRAEAGTKLRSRRTRLAVFQSGRSRTAGSSCAAGRQRASTSSPTGHTLKWTCWLQQASAGLGRRGLHDPVPSRGRAGRP